MKKLMYLLVVGVLFTFTACGGETEACADDCSKECCANGHPGIAKCGGDYCAKACCLGCKATDGDAKCKQDHSCCAKKPCADDCVKDCCVNTDNTAVDIEYSEDHNHNGGHDHDHK